MTIAPPQFEYIQQMGWTQFLKAVQPQASPSLVREFYSNLAGMCSDVVFVRGREIDISPAAINSFYSLPDISKDGFTAITQQEPLPSEISTSLTGTNIGLHPDWRSIARSQLTIEAKNWPYFISARLMPVSIDSEIQRVLAMLTYVIVTRLTIDMGRVIHREMMVVGDARSNRALGFPVLITQLYQVAVVDIYSDYPADILKLQLKITSEMYISGEKVKAQRQIKRVVKQEDEEQGQRQQQQSHEQYHEQQHEEQAHQIEFDQSQAQREQQQAHQQRAVHNTVG